MSTLRFQNKKSNNFKSRTERKEQTAILITNCSSIIKCINDTISLYMKER